MHVLTVRCPMRFRGFLDIVVRAGRQSEFLNIFEYFLNAVKAYKHIGTAYVTSAVPLSEAQKRKDRGKTS